MTGSIEVAFPEMERNFVKRTLLPFFGFCEPENPTLGIKVRTLPAKIFLAANFNELVHELHSCVKPIDAGTVAGIRAASPRAFCRATSGNPAALVDIAVQHVGHRLGGLLACKYLRYIAGR
jgi:hypothetical protein